MTYTITESRITGTPYSEWLAIIHEGTWSDGTQAAVFATRSEAVAFAAAEEARFIMATQRQVD